MPTESPLSEDDLFELRLFLEEVTCDACRFRHASDHGLHPEQVDIRQDVRLGPNAFVDILVRVPERMSYFVEVDYGYSETRIGESLRRKFGKHHPLFEQVSKLVLVIDGHANPERVRDLAAQIVPSSWELEIWDEKELQSIFLKQFDAEIATVSSDKLVDLRTAIDRSKGTYAFGNDYRNDPLDGSLLWAFGYWRLRDLFQQADRRRRAILPPSTYEEVVVVFADLSGFSGYVRDTPRMRVIQDCLSAFCAKSRLQIVNDGGMLYQFLGDAVIGLFGIPDHRPGYQDRSFECARSLLMLGDKISHAWQLELDRLQPVRGAHIGMAIGNLQVASLRPFSRTHMGVIGDAINIAARLSSHAQPGQIVMSNTLYRRLAPTSGSLLKRAEPIEAKNVGQIQAWYFDEADHPDTRGRSLAAIS